MEVGEPGSRNRADRSLARTSERNRDAPDSGAWAPLGLVETATAVAQRFEVLKTALAEAQAEAALARTGLAQALAAALAARAETKIQAREFALKAYRETHARHVRARRRNRLVKLAEKVLGRLGPLGRTLLVSASGLRGHPLFDETWYRSVHPDMAGWRADGLTHYLLTGGDQRRRPHLLFDAEAYVRDHGPEIGRHGLTPLEHFARVGSLQGFDPHPLFSAGHYLAQHPTLIESRQSLVEHYLSEGWKSGSSPHPLFAPGFYARQLTRSERSQPPLLHYLSVGSARGLKPHPLFDPDWYRSNYRDVAAAGAEPLTHYVVSGSREGREPGPWFDSAHYRAQRGPALSPEANPLIDYLETGAWIVGEPAPGFPSFAYLSANPRLAGEGLTPLEHWASLRMGLG